MGDLGYNHVKSQDFGKIRGLETWHLRHNIHTCIILFRKKHATVANILNAMPLNISYRRSLMGPKLLEWHNLVARIVNVNLHEGRD